MLRLIVSAPTYHQCSETSEVTETMRLFALWISPKNRSPYLLCPHKRKDTIYVKISPRDILHVKRMQPSLLRNPEGRNVPSLIPLSLLAAFALAFSFFKIASTSSPTNKTLIFQDPGYPLCFPPPSSARIQPLSEHECRQALGVFLRNLLFLLQC